jgi:hypothetical protein
MSDFRGIDILEIIKMFIAMTFLIGFSIFCSAPNKVSLSENLMIICNCFVFCLERSIKKRVIMRFLVEIMLVMKII